MRRLKTEILIIGSGAAAVLAANRLSTAGHKVILVNPNDSINIDDVRPVGGLALWGAAYRAEKEIHFSKLFEKLCDRVREVLPASLDQVRLAKTEHWSILSSTPVHKHFTQEIEKEYFKLEKKNWGVGHFRLVNPENVLARTRQLGIDLRNVAQIEGAVTRSYGLWWDAAQIGVALSQYVHAKKTENPNQFFENCSIASRHGRRLIVETSEDEVIAIEPDKATLVFLTGDLLPSVRSLVANCDESWIQGVRKRRREQHCVWFEHANKEASPTGEDLWIELGSTRYRWSMRSGLATWKAKRGPDGLDHVVDEGLRLSIKGNGRFVRSKRGFCLEWEWKAAQWRQTAHDTYWATAFEGDLWNMMELIWNLPVL